ncbi:hypothetical protein XcodCFBP4690_07760 [Xanthomonas codiaei]|uniref:Uncharacterized protein n=2 Tax=Xanthomonas codiaei TaxID=56463 RepID=A0A2S7CT99_9XANT|nr:hypothetical protein [Xanthomonas codiaei]PPU64740.1 hypothetical protein XcodCFBP4690_07760 [Xanthomonas codiaei]
MSSVPRALATHRQRRRWRKWPWGWMALGLSLAAWACLAVMVLLVTASIGMPGDGNQAMQATRIPMLVTLLAGALATVGGLVASPVAFSLRRQPGAAAMGVALLLLLLLLFCVSLPGLRA